MEGWAEGGAESGRHYLDENVLDTVAQVNPNTSLHSFNGDYTVKVQPELISLNTACSYITLRACMCVCDSAASSNIALSPRTATAITARLWPRAWQPIKISQPCRLPRAHEQRIGWVGGCGGVATLPYHHPKSSQGLHITWLIQGLSCCYLQDIEWSRAQGLAVLKGSFPAPLYYTAFGIFRQMRSWFFTLKLHFKALKLL